MVWVGVTLYLDVVSVAHTAHIVDSRCLDTFDMLMVLLIARCISLS